jgi:nitroimidazol reductase NimA-like FMN-containing flavoprotein (pyridoxamine 5'-phosphate oxidase superfamily)
VSTTASAGVEELSGDECRRLLAAHHFGRLAFVLDGGPVVLPVNYGFDGRSVVIRTATGAKVEQAPMTAAAFEIDAAAPDGSWGWSVLARGVAFDVTDTLDEHSEVLRAIPVQPWAPGDKPKSISLAVSTVTGRRFGTPAR